MAPAWLTFFGLIAGCEKPTAVDSPAREASIQQPLTPRALSVDEAFAGIAAQTKSFAGAYFDEKGVLVVRMVSLADSSLAWSALRQALIDRVRVDARSIGSFSADDQLIPHGRRVEQAAVAFQTLYDLKRRIAGSVFDSEDVVSLDLDEVHSRIVVGVLTTAATDKVRADLRLTTSERPLVDVRVESSVTATRQQTLFSRQRPLTGGYEIGPIACPMTIGAMRGSEQLILTASHCTAVSFALDGGPTRQNNNQANFGAEVTDPTPYSCGTFFNPKKCRRADAAAYDASAVDMFPNDTVGWVPGRIARTLFASAGMTQLPGSRDIDLANPYWTVIAEIAYPLLGEVLHKVGMLNGWTYGPVYETCKDLAYGTTNLRIVCNDKANMFARPGDSGGPVFAPYGGYQGTVSFYGVVWAHQGGASAVFSNFSQMKQDLGYLRLF